MESNSSLRDDTIMILKLKVNTYFKLIQLNLIIQTSLSNFSRSGIGYLNEGCASSTTLCFFPLGNFVGVQAGDGVAEF